MIRFAFLLLCSIAKVGAQSSDALLLYALGQVESGGKRLAVGDHGAALGRYQLHASSWRDANAQLTRERRDPVPRSDWRTSASQDVIALAFLRDLRRRFALIGIPRPTPTQLASAWNLGFTAARRRGFPATDYARRVTALAR